MQQMNIRSAEPADAPTILQLIRDLASYEREPDAVLATEADIRDSLFGTNPRVFALVCEQGDAGVIGFAMYFYNYSTWLGRHGIYLEDLYVTPEARGRGAGKALLRAVARVARDEGCGRFEWSVLDWNTPAIEFYRACGARSQDEWIGYRMDRAALEAFADSPD